MLWCGRFRCLASGHCDVLRLLARSLIGSSLSALSILRVVSTLTWLGFSAPVRPRIRAAFGVSRLRPFAALAFAAIPAFRLTCLTRSTRSLGFGDARCLIHLMLALGGFRFLFCADIRKFGDFDFRESTSESEDA